MCVHLHIILLTNTSKCVVLHVRCESLYIRLFGMNIELFLNFFHSISGLLAHSENNRDDDVKDVDSVCCGTGSQATTKTNVHSTAENNTMNMKNI